MLQNEIYEEYLLNSTPYQFNHHFGGFIFRYGGMDISSNCIYPLYNRNDYPDDKVQEIEKFLNNTEFAPVYRLICQENYSRLETLLFNYNYDKIAESYILLCQLLGKQDELFRFADFNESGIFADYYEPGISDFFDDYFYLKQYDQNQQFCFLNSYYNQFNTTQCSSSKLFLITLIEEKNLIGQAIIIQQGKLAILKDIVISPALRGLGYSSKMLNSILTYCLKHSMSQLIAEVPVDNEPAVNLFDRNGMFHNIYNVIYRQKIQRPKGRFIFD